MEKEFNLSLHEQVIGYFPKDKVKEFIRLLEENSHIQEIGGTWFMIIERDKFDKLAGVDLK